MAGSEEEITVFLKRSSKAPARAEQDQLYRLVEAQLKSLARSLLRGGSGDHSLQPTILVDEAFVRLMNGPERDWQDRSQFFKIAYGTMRRILIDSARRKQSEKHGGGWQRHELLDAELAVDSTSDELFAVDEALSRLAAQEPDAARLVELRFFAGLSLDETADCLGMSSRTAYRNWAYARAWLRRELDKAGDGQAI